MAEFRFSGLAASGQSVQGTVYAPNKRTAQQKVQSLAEQHGFTIAGLALAAYFQASLGIVTVLLALLLAALPLGIVVPTFLWLDRFEAEPTKYLVIAFLWGALVASLVAAIFNTGAMLIIEAAGDPTSAMAATAGCVVKMDR